MAYTHTTQVQVFSYTFNCDQTCGVGEVSAKQQLAMWTCAKVHACTEQQSALREATESREGPSGTSTSKRSTLIADNLMTCADLASSNTLTTPVPTMCQQSAMYAKFAKEWQQQQRHHLC